MTSILAHIHHPIYSGTLVVDADVKTQDTSIAPPPLIRDSVLGTLFSDCFTFLDRFFNPHGRIRLLDVEESQSPGTIIAPPTPIMVPDIEEGKPPGTSINPTYPKKKRESISSTLCPPMKRRALLVGISYVHSRSQTWRSLECPHNDVDDMINLLVGK